MKATIQYNNSTYTADLSLPLDISLPLSNSDDNPIAWYIDRPVIEPVKMGDWTGKVSEGASTNFNNIFFNPHGHGTHTECLGHITREFYSINKSLQQFFFMTQVVSIQPERREDDFVITKEQVAEALHGKTVEALVIRTLPNADAKRSKNYSNSNPPYIEEAAATFICESGIMHLLIDLPSVDKEKDDGLLLAHKAFWNVTDVNQLNSDARLDATITEMIFVPDSVSDGMYMLNLQIASFENDASPGKPVLYSLENVAESDGHGH